MKISLEAFFEDLTPGYLQDRIEEVSELVAKFDEKDYEYLEKKFHKVAGSAGSYGLKALSALASDIEVGLAANEGEAVADKFNEYKSMLTSIELSFEG